MVPPTGKSTAAETSKQTSSPGQMLPVTVALLVVISGHGGAARQSSPTVIIVPVPQPELSEISRVTGLAKLVGKLKNPVEDVPAETPFPNNS